MKGLFAEIFEENFPGFKVMPIRSRQLQVAPPKKVGLEDHTVRPFAKRVAKVGGIGRSNKQEGKSMWQQKSTFNFGWLQVKVGQKILLEKPFTW